MPYRLDRSGSYITNLDGEGVQHIEYVPFGEVFIEERNSIWNTPYLFNAKEFDEETGLYYYGARYYDPRLSLWISTDALQEKYPQHTSYLYVGSNPVNAIDTDGYKIVFINGKIGGGSPKTGAPYWNGYSKGIEKYLKEMGRKFEYNVMINTYQVDRINNPKSNETYYVDYQNTNDPVLFLFDINLGLGSLKNANLKIREKSGDVEFNYIHRSPIDSDFKFWNKIKNYIHSSKD